MYEHKCKQCKESFTSEEKDTLLCIKCDPEGDALTNWDLMSKEERKEKWDSTVQHYLDNNLPCTSCGSLEGKPTCTNMICAIRWGERKLKICYPEET